MQKLDNLIPSTLSDDIRSYIETRINEIYLIADEINNSLSTSRQLKQEILEIVTNMSNKLNASSIDILSNFGTDADFEKGMIDADTNNTTFLYTLGKIVGSKIKSCTTPIDILVDNTGPFTTVTQALIQLKRVTNITINYSFAESYVENIVVENVDKLTINAKYPYSLRSTNSTTNKPSLAFKNCRLIEFKNIEFNNSPIIDANDLVYQKPFLKFEDSLVKFVNCTFIPNTDTDDYFIVAKNSKIIFDNCIFQSSTKQVNIVSSYDYPSDVIAIKCNIPTNVNLINNSNSAITFKRID